MNFYFFDGDKNMTFFRFESLYESHVIFLESFTSHGSLASHTRFKNIADITNNSFKIIHTVFGINQKISQCHYDEKMYKIFSHLIHRQEHLQLFLVQIRNLPYRTLVLHFDSNASVHFEWNIFVLLAYFINLWKLHRTLTSFKFGSCIINEANILELAQRWNRTTLSDTSNWIEALKMKAIRIIQ